MEGIERIYNIYNIIKHTNVNLGRMRIKTEQTIVLVDYLSYEHTQIKVIEKYTYSKAKRGWEKARIKPLKD